MVRVVLSALAGMLTGALVGLLCWFAWLAWARPAGPLGAGGELSLLLFVALPAGAALGLAAGAIPALLRLKRERTERRRYFRRWHGFTAL